jgi:hypothetical protein
MSVTISEPLRGRELFNRFLKFTLRRVVMPIEVVLPIAYFLRKIALYYGPENLELARTENSRI